jgi:NADH-quinone oxidoreductase subunit C
MENLGHVRHAVARMRERYPQAIEQEEVIQSGLVQLTVKSKALLDLLSLAKEELEFNVLYDLTAADHLEREPYFHVIYVLHSHERQAKLILKVKAERGNPTLPTATRLWPMADWYERELYDFYGIRFAEHPNLRRLLMPEEWIGHPLRKDYPLTEEPVQFKSVRSEKLPSEVIPKQYKDE